MYWAVYAIVLFAGWAMMVREGLWSNTLNLLNIIISGLVAFAFYSPIVAYLDEDVTNGQHTYWLDFAVIWALYAVAMVVMRTLMGAASKTRLRFKNPIDPVGGPLMGFIAAWILAAFTLATLHVAPMGKEAFSGKLVYSNVDSASFITQPDATWLKFIQAMSKPSAMGAESVDHFGANPFLKIYTDRREKFDKADGLIVKRGA
ncbi:MAG TPA: CvpA family protein [Lacipirellulaceae bacterium]|nr:CvpA family protein [Lacipirellulaceae bacterium]